MRETYKREDGTRAQPDAVVHLPEDKHIVVDAKVSLRQAEMLRDLGVKPSKSLPKKLVEADLTEQTLMLPSLAAGAAVEDFGEEPAAEDDTEPALDENIPF